MNPHLTFYDTTCIVHTYILLKNITAVRGNISSYIFPTNAQKMKL